MVKKSNSIYITTTLPYINAEPHVGFAMELIRADVLARYSKLEGFDVFFNTGTDEHGQKIYESAEKKGVEIKKYCDSLATRFLELIPVLNISKDINFIRTTNEKHVAAAQYFWNLVKKKGFIEKKIYRSKYCVGCELEKTDSELENSRCPLHPNREIENINEENYFFLFSKFKEKLLSLYKSDPNYVSGQGRFNEIRSFVGNDLQDFSISRLKSKVPWGVTVPGDNEHVMYVWFDALVSYISTLGWPENNKNFEKYWVNGTTYQYAGKDNLRQQSAMWQAMLMAANLPNTKKIRINGFINGENGSKMSKSLGNVISPFYLVDKYGTDSLRYFLLRHIPAFEDGEMSIDIFHDKYSAHLVNGLGNLANRILNLSEKYIDDVNNYEMRYDPNFSKFMDSGNFPKALDFVWEKIGDLDKYVSREEPYKIIKINPKLGKEIIKESRNRLYEINEYLEVFMPETFEKLKVYILENKKPNTPLFPRLDKNE